MIQRVLMRVARDAFHKHPDELRAEGKWEMLIDMVALEQIEQEELKKLTGSRSS